MNKTAKMLMIVGALLLIVFSIWGIGAMRNNRVFYKYDSFSSPDRNHIIIVKSNGAVWPFGAEDIRIIARNKTFLGKLTQKTYTTCITNDGKALGENNIVVTWQDNENATIILCGEEQQPETISIQFGDKIVIQTDGGNTIQ